MSQVRIRGVEVRGITTCVPASLHENSQAEGAFSSEEVERVVKMAGVKRRHLVTEAQCTSDLCGAAAERLLEQLKWPRESVDLLLFVSQTPDYYMPSTACLLQHRLRLSDRCAALDVGLGCSGWPYGMAVAASMLVAAGRGRALVLVGETPSKVCDPADRATWLIFGDAGSATALECMGGAGDLCFVLQSDGRGADDFIVRAGGFRDRFNPNPRQHFITMNGANIFAFTMKRVPALIRDTLALAEMTEEEVDYFVFHQANAFIIEHLRKKQGLPPEKVPIVIDRFGNTGGSSVPLTATQGGLVRPSDRALRLVLLGYGVGLSWGAVAMTLGATAVLDHLELDGRAG